METTANNKGIVPLYGLFAGLAMVLIMLFLYLGGVSAFMGFLGWIKYPIIIFIAVLAAQKVKKQNGGYLQFSEAVKIVFGVFALGFLLETIFSYILLNFIDPGFRDALAQATMEKMGEMMKRFGATEEQIEKAITDGMNKNNYTLGKVFVGYGVVCIVSFIFALIVAAIVKKNKPVFDDNAFNQ
ncbi:MAG: DUF4199 domain-containing protein [Chitinophagaceae bacterium]